MSEHITIPVDTQLATELRAAVGGIMHGLRASYGRPLTQTAVLGRLEREGPQCIGELATAEHVRPQSMTQTLADLEALELIERTPDEQDRRRIRIALTDRGSAEVIAERARRDGRLAVAIATFTPEERQVLGQATVLLERLASDEQQDRTPTPNQDHQLASDLRIAVGRLMRRLRTASTFPLTQGSVLGRLRREGSQYIRELAAAERVRSQSMSQTLDELEALGLIERRPDPNDGRRTQIVLTQQGEATVLTELARRDGWLAETIATFTPAEQRVLAAAVPLLERLADR